MTLLTSMSLSALPDPDIIEPLDFEALLTEIKTDILHFCPELKQALELESEPTSKIAEAFAYRILHERKRANDMALSLMLAKAQGAQLDHLGALPFIQTQRKLLQAEDKSQVPPVPAIFEADDEYRSRLQMALEGFSTAGPIGAYIYHALAAHEDIKDVAIDAPRFSRLKTPANLPQEALVVSPEYRAGLTDPLPGDVAVTVLSRKGNGTPTPEVIQAVEQQLNEENLRPLTDRPRCRAAQIIPYQVQANLWFYAGPDTAIILAEARKKLDEFIQDQQRIGHDITVSGLHAAIHRPGVQRVELIEPKGNIAINAQQAGFCTKVQLSNQGVDV